MWNQANAATPSASTTTIFERDDNGRWWFALRRYKSYARTNPTGPGPDLTVFELPEIPL